ncbi:hypothetical protein Pla108_29050 [Botrimarina colliarenosi]|uniref:Uncharacterized protein n=1 Tax=Botrimarina colliarenosi TaxID=2528001 RepID=A0A5C6A938_9BACT|nr:hypothetical protein [Botrimarina colliarenosi]TWT95828.1 hypothetical protein Pla108_29050 [Botrimarina colliarenosi]
MEKEDLRELARNASRQPFRIRMTGGETFDVRHQDSISVSDYHGSVIVVQDGKEHMHIFTLMNISTIEMLPAPVTPSSATNN